MHSGIVCVKSPFSQIVDGQVPAIHFKSSYEADNLIKAHKPCGNA